MTRWYPNTGAPPRHTPECECVTNAPCVVKVYVRLRNGREPADPWPVDTGKRETTCWRFGMRDSAWDIVEWRPA